MKYMVLDNTVVFADGEQLEFDGRIRNYIEYEGILIVVLSLPESSPYYYRNALGIDVENKKIIWHIDETNKSKNGYGSVYINKIIGGVELTGEPGVAINPISGKIIRINPWFK